MIKNIIHGFVALISGQAINVIIQIILVPVYLSILSPIVYGEWLVLTSLANYLSTFDFGMSSAVTNKLTKLYARNKYDEYNTTINTSLIIYLSIILVGVSGVAIIVNYYPIVNCLGLKEISRSDSNYIIIIISVYVLLSFPANVLISIFKTTGDLSSTEWIKNAKRIIEMMLIVYALSMNYSLVIIALIQLLVLLTITITTIKLVIMRFSFVRINVSYAKYNEAKLLFKPSIAFFVINISVLMSEQGSIILLSLLCSGDVVALYVVTRTLINFIRQIAGLINTAMWPYITIMESKGNYYTLRIVHSIITAATIIITLSYAMIIICNCEIIFIVWLNNSIQIDYVLIILMCVYKVLQSVWVGSGVICAASNNNKVLSISYLLSSTIGLLTAIITYKYIGIWSLPIGFIIGEAVTCLHYVIKDACIIIKRSYKEFSIKLWISIVLMVVISYLLTISINNNQMILRVIMFHVILAIVYIVVTMFIMFSKAERLYVLKYIYSIKQMI